MTPLRVHWLRRPNVGVFKFHHGVAIETTGGLCPAVYDLTGPGVRKHTAAEFLQDNSFEVIKSLDGPQGKFAWACLEQELKHSRPYDVCMWNSEQFARHVMNGEPDGEQVARASFFASTGLMIFYPNKRSA